MKSKLNNRDRELYSLVSQAAFSNPFSEERGKLDKQLSKTAKNKRGLSEIDAIRAMLHEHISGHDKKSTANIKAYEGEDRDILKYALLFEAFHFHIPDYDALIETQIEKPNTLPKAEFSNKLIARLTSRGITKADAIQYHSLFYQLRRAFYFIDHQLIGKCRSMRELKKHLWNNVFTGNIKWYEIYLNKRMEDFSTFLLGETGTGKGTAAAAIGRCGRIPYDSERNCFNENFMESFVSINLSQFQESLIESELFGHSKGAFTGAIDNYKGLFARCSKHGSVFLDEIGDVSTPIQIKLLNVIQDRTFTPVGSHKAGRFNGRVIAATNQPIDKLRQDGKFRDDLYYRLCSDIIHVPSLHERIQEDPGELRLLLDHIIRKITGTAAPELCDEIHDLLISGVGVNYTWPGNVRELEQAVRRILITRKYQAEAQTHGTDTLEHLQNAMSKGTLNANELLSSYSKLLYNRLGSYEQVAQALDLDRRTVKKYIQAS